jgi:lipoprotein-anchoring transpeptidase ErfK/SrfK
MILRSIFAAGVLASLAGTALAQGYPPPYPPPPGAYQGGYGRPIPAMPVPDDDDDDLPAHLRAAPGSAPPPPGGYRGPFSGREAYQGPQPGYQQAPPPAYGGRNPQVGSGQPESYGAAPSYPGQQAAPAPGYAYPPQAYPQQGYPQQQGSAEQYQQGAPIPLQPVGPREATGSVRPNTVATLPADEQPDEGKPELPAQFKRQIVQFQTNEPAGTIVIDTANTFLYLVLGNGQAMRYGVGVGREGFTWAGAERVTRMKEWPDWYPPAEMIERQPYLPRFMAGGETNPLGARALYLGKTIYRIHGTNQPSTIGKYVSSGCIRLTNEDIQDLYSRVQVGTRVVVLPGHPPAQPATAQAAPQQR